MKCLTICQPYAHFIVTGEKLVENRDWFTSYRGPVLIHAGKSRSWLRPFGDSLPTSDMAFGSIVGVANLADCLDIDEIDDRKHDDKYPWIVDHPHTEGPWCWVLTLVRRFASPVPCRGALGLFDVPESAVEDAIHRAAVVKPLHELSPVRANEEGAP